MRGNKARQSREPFDQRPVRAVVSFGASFSIESNYPKVPLRSLSQLIIHGMLN